MGTSTALASAMGLGLLAGARLYATAFVIGLLLRFDWITAPAAWQQASVLADTRVLIVSGILCAIEFFADKTPWVDSAWDAVHTFIRPIGAALLTSSLFAGLEPATQAVVFLLAGGMALSGHSAKAAARLVVNHSPEPFSNVALSLAEDGLVASGLYLAAKHPYVLAAIALVFLAISALLIPRTCRALRAESIALGARLRSWFGATRKPQLTADQRKWIDEHCDAAAPRRLFRVIATADVKGLRSAVGILCVTDRQAGFLTRRWGRSVVREIAPILGFETRRGFLVDQLVLTTTDGLRTRFDLPAGQREGDSRQRVATA
jgi:hypothetical protein